MTAGHFSSPNVIDIAAGAPQHSGSGKVGTSFFVLFPAVELKSSSVACYNNFCFSPCTGLHFQNRWCVFGEEFSSLRENGMSSDAVSYCSLIVLFLIIIQHIFCIEVIVILYSFIRNSTTLLFNLI